MSTYKEFSEAPGFTRVIWENGKLLNRNPGTPLWGHKTLGVPPIGTRVTITFNQFGAGSVAGYFVEGNWLGLLVDIDKQPEWHLKQNGTNRRIHVYGPEFALISD